MEAWGKASGGQFHHLVHHCADVAACFEALTRQPVIKARFEKAAGRNLVDVDLARLAVLAFLHDVGKLHPGFQVQARPELPSGVTKMGHLIAGAALIMNRAGDGLFKGLGLEALSNWQPAGGLLMAMLAHHGRPFEVDERAERGWSAYSVYDPNFNAAQFGKAMRSWFPEAFKTVDKPLPTAPAFQHLFCGMLTLADWLGSTETLFSFEEEFDNLYIEKARQRAQKAVAGTGLLVDFLRQSAQGRTDFETLTGYGSSRSAQAAVGATDIEAQLVILEAETGSGKTEAALWRFLRLFEVGKVDSLYFALPTRAAAKQIHGRVVEAISRVFGEEAPEVVLAIPGYLKVSEIRGRHLPGWRVRWDDDGGKDESTLVSRWSAESNKKFLASMIAVGTIDQAMLAGLQVKHAHLRAASLSRSLLVIDEVHASDRYMTQIQSHLLKSHIGLGGHAFLMSATLGAQAREKWLGGNETSSFDSAVKQPYPAVWTGLSGDPGAVASDGRVKPVSMELIDDWSAVRAAKLAINAAQQGAKVLVIRNTVPLAQDTYSAVSGLGEEKLLWQVAGSPALHHSRFAVEDRNLLDAEVEKALAVSPELRADGGLIVIGTQTLEQSLDIDADLLITDLCPADVLLQRIGRLHRHALPRPSGFEHPKCVVLSPEGGLDRFTNVGFQNGFENGIGKFSTNDSAAGGVYTNLHACELTRQLIASQPEWRIPEMNRFIVESATHQERIDALNLEKGEAWQTYWDTIYGSELAEAMAAQHVALPFELDFLEMGLFSSDEESIRTRLGAEGAKLVFQEGTIGPFGQLISAITLPSHWSKGLKVSDEPIFSDCKEGVLLFQVESVIFHYDRGGLRKSAKNETTT